VWPNAAILGSLQRELGSLSRIACWARVFCMVNSAPGFTRQPAVINGFTDLIISVFGPERGAHARSAVGLAELPFRIPVEIEGEVELRPLDALAPSAAHTSHRGTSSPVSLRGRLETLQSSSFARRQSMQIVGPVRECSAECERILRTLPLWFGQEESLLEYAQDAERYATFLVMQHGRAVGFVTLHEHFPQAWEVHCIAVQADHRGHGSGRGLQAGAEDWLVNKGVRLLQVKTLAASFPSEEYAQTREFYRAVGYLPLEVFPQLWQAGLPVLLLVKVLRSTA
jgi:GNAT superfamily N-acetyltransferase